MAKNSKHATRTTHGDTGSRLYNIYGGMKSRCNIPTSGSYNHYGAKGISVCKEWLDSYENFKEWALKNGYAEDLTLDRIRSTDDYAPDNCGWVSMKVQQNNRCNNHLIAFNGETHTLSEWANILGFKPKTLAKRINEMKWDVEKAFTTPLLKHYKKVGEC